MSTLTLAGVAELADLLDVRRTTISQWHSRQHQNGFPNPLSELACGPVWDQDEVVEWWKGYTPLRNMRKVGSLPHEREEQARLAAEEEQRRALEPRTPFEPGGFLDPAGAL